MTALPISLPAGFIPSIQEGDQVKAGQVIAESQIPTEEVVNIPQELSIKLSQVRKVLKKIPGEEVTEGDILAVKKSFFGTKNIILRSRVSGTVIRYERDSGNLVIKKGIGVSGEAKTIISPVDGKAILCNNKEIVIQTYKNTVTGNKASGDKGEGEMFRLESDDPYHLNAHAIGKIVIGGRLSREMLLKGIGIGVEGIIGTQIQDSDIEHIIEKKFHTPILEITRESMNEVLSWPGKRVFVDGESKSIILLQHEFTKN